MPAKLERCVEEVTNKSRGVESPWAICTNALKGEEMTDEDMLVYPEEFKMGFKEEQKEHNDVTKGNKELITKIVLAHLKEDPHYYTKSKSCDMKAYVDSKIHDRKFREKESEPKVPAKAEEAYSESSKTQMSKFRTKFPNVKSTMSEGNPTPKKAEEVQDVLGRGKPGLSSPQEESAFKKYGEKIHKQVEKAKGEEEEKRQSPIRRSMKHVPHEKDALRNLQTVKAEEEGLMDKIKSGIKSITSSPKPTEYTKPTPLTKTFVRQQRNKAEEEKSIIDYKQSKGTKLPESPGSKENTEALFHVTQKKADEEEKCADCGKKLSTQLIEKAEEELGSEKVEESKNKTIVEKFAEEMRPASPFKAPEVKK